MTKQRNCSIDFLRLMCSVLVIAIHTQPVLWLTQYKNGNIQILVRIAVPFFFCVTGYFLKEGIQKSKKGKQLIVAMLNKTFVTYAIWSFVYFVLILLLNPLLVSVTSLKWMIFDFMVNGSYYHLWYMVAVLWCLVIFQIIYKLKLIRYVWKITLVLYIFGLLGTSYYVLGSKIPGLSMLIESIYFNIIRRVFLMGLPFIALGWKIYEKKDRIFIIPVRKLISFLIVIMVLFISENILVVVKGIAKNTVISVFLYPLVAIILMLCMRFPLTKFSRSAYYCRIMATTAYFIHPMVITLINLVCTISGIPLFFIITCFSLFIGWETAYVCKIRKKRRR